ncbi:MAG: alpha/beta fold hydrolase [Chitinophagaceae bacterium]
MTFAQKLVLRYLRAKLNITAVISEEKAAKKAFKIFCTPQIRKKKLHRVPPKGEKLTFTLNGLTVRGQRWNHPQPNKIQIIHGFESSYQYFDKYIAAFIEKGYEVIAFDAPAHGRSDGKQLTLPLYIAMLQKIQELYGPVNKYMAHSLGGLALTHFLETQPDTSGIKVVLLAPATETVSAIDGFFNLLELNPGIRKHVDDLILEIAGVPSEYFSIRRAVNNIKAQILWFHDEGDRAAPVKDALAVQADHHPNIELVITKGLGHRKVYKDEAVRKRILEFL